MFISALTGQRVDDLFDKIHEVIEQNTKRISTGLLNDVINEAIAMVPTPDESLKGKVLDCVQTGYTLNDKVIRHAKVAVGE